MTCHVSLMHTPTSKVLLMSLYKSKSCTVTAHAQLSLSVGWGRRLSNWVK